MAFGLLATGFERKRLIDVKSEIEASLKLTLGANINLLPSSVLSQLVGVFSDRESDLWELLEEVYNSAYPDSASGLSLDNVAAITGVRRLEATYSTVVVTATGSAGTIIPAGTVFSVTGSPAQPLRPWPRPRSRSEARLILSAKLKPRVQSTHRSGLWRRSILQLRVLDSVTNADAADVGRDEETDSELRVRRETELPVVWQLNRRGDPGQDPGLNRRESGNCL